MTGPAAVLIYGPIGTGNHLAKEIFRVLGCAGSTKDVQPFDDQLPSPNGGSIMWGHSVPSNGYWPSIASAIDKTFNAGFAPHLVALTRAQYPAVESAFDSKRAAKRSEAERDYATAMTMISGAIAIARGTQNVRWTYLAYEDLTRHPADTTRWLAERIGLIWPVDPKIWDFVQDDTNIKHWRGRWMSCRHE